MDGYFYQRPSDLGKLVIVGGPGGTGSSTIAKILAKQWGLHRIDAGEIMRNKTQKEKLEEYLENQVTTHPETDRNIDQFLVRMSYYPNTLIESKNFAAIATTMGIPTTIRIWIIADLDTRVKRVLGRDYRLEEDEELDKSSDKYKEVRQNLIRRQSNDIRRWRGLYHVDLSKPERYNDIVLDTTGIGVSRTIHKLFKMIDENDHLRKGFSPEQLKY